MTIDSIHQLQLALSSLSIYRNLLMDPVIKKFLSLIHISGCFQLFQGLDDSHEFHPVVCCGLLSPADLFFMFIV